MRKREVTSRPDTMARNSAFRTAALALRHPGSRDVRGRCDDDRSGRAARASRCRRPEWKRRSEHRARVELELANGEKRGSAVPIHTEGPRSCTEAESWTKFFRLGSRVMPAAGASEIVASKGARVSFGTRAGRLLRNKRST